MWDVILTIHRTIQMGEVRSKVACGFAGGSRQPTVVVFKCLCWLVFLIMMFSNFTFYCHKVQVIFCFKTKESIVLSSTTRFGRDYWG